MGTPVLKEFDMTCQECGAEMDLVRKTRSGEKSYLLFCCAEHTCRRETLVIRPESVSEPE